MSSTPKRERLESSNKNASYQSTPLINEKFDRHCTNCGSVIENAALEKFSGQCCVRCMHEVDFRDKADGLWRRCVRCDTFNRCTFKFCYICGRHNQHYDADKQNRLELANEGKLREKFREEITADVKKHFTDDIKAQLTESIRAEIEQAEREELKASLKLELYAEKEDKDLLEECTQMETEFASQNGVSAQNYQQSTSDNI